VSREIKLYYKINKKNKKKYILVFFNYTYYNNNNNNNLFLRLLSIHTLNWCMRPPCLWDKGPSLHFWLVQNSNRFSEHLGWFKMGHNPKGKVSEMHGTLIHAKLRLPLKILGLFFCLKNGTLEGRFLLS
jgi:hypothetical protein